MKRQSTTNRVRRRQATWLVATLIVLATTGVVYLGVQEDRPARTSAVVANAAPTSAPAEVNNGKRDDSTRPYPIGGNQSAIPEGRIRRSRMDNPFDFIRGLAKAAYAGDGEAQYLIAREFGICGMTLSLVRKSSDPEELIWSLGGSWTQTMKERTFAEYKRCSRLAREDPFAGLPPRAGGYTDKYWKERATEANYPLAMVEKAHTTLVRLSVEPLASGQATERARAEALESLTHAMLSGNPDTLLLMGFNGFQSEDRERQVQAAAWTLAGCNAGADCGFDSAIIPFWMCDDLECQLGADVEIMLNRALSREEFARAYALSQHIAEELRNENVEAIEALLPF